MNKLALVLTGTITTALSGATIAAAAASLPDFAGPRPLAPRLAQPSLDHSAHRATLSAVSGRGLVAERDPSKVEVRVRFPPPAPPLPRAVSP